MKRSRFLKSLLALPFLPKALGADQGAALPKGPYIPVELPKCQFCLDTGLLRFPDTKELVACFHCAPTVEQLPPSEGEVMPSSHYSPTTMKEIDRIWRECSKKVAEGMRTPWG